MSLVTFLALYFICSEVHSILLNLDFWITREMSLVQPCWQDKNINIPLAKIFLPGNAEEFDKSFRDNYRNGLNYFRLSEEKHRFLKLASGLSLLRKGNRARKAVIFVGPTLRFFDDDSKLQGLRIAGWKIYNPNRCKNIRIY